MLSVEAGGPRSASGSLRSLTAGVSKLRVLDPGRLGHCWRPPSVGAARRPLPRCPAGGCDLPAAPRGGPRCAPSCRGAAPERGRPGLGPWGRGGGRGPSVARHWPGSCAGGTGEAHVRSRLADKGARCSLSSTVFFLSYRREYLDPARLSEALGFALRSEGRRCAVARGPTCPCALLPAASWSRRPAEAPASAAPKRACPGTRRCLPEASSPRRGAGGRSWRALALRPSRACCSPWCPRKARPGWAGGNCSDRCRLLGENQRDAVLNPCPLQLVS